MEGVHVMGNVGEKNIPPQMGQFRYHATILFCQLDFDDITYYISITFEY